MAQRGDKAAPPSQRKTLTVKNVCDALTQTKGDRGAAAEILGRARQTLRKFMRTYDERALRRAEGTGKQPSFLFSEFLLSLEIDTRERAEQNVVNAIYNKGDEYDQETILRESHWYLARRHPDYAPKSEQKISGEITINVSLDDTLEKLRKQSEGKSDSITEGDN